MNRPGTGPPSPPSPPSPTALATTVAGGSPSGGPGPGTGTGTAPGSGTRAGTATLVRTEFRSAPAGEAGTEVVVIGAGPAGVAAAEGVAAVAGEDDPARPRRDRGLRLVLVDDAPAGRGGWSGRLAVAALREAVARERDWAGARAHLLAVRRDVVHRHEARIRSLQVRLGPHALMLSGRARLTGPGLVAVEPQGVDLDAGPPLLRARRIVLATGCVPARPDVTGLAETAFLTAPDLSDLLELDPPPATVAVLGAGSTGCAIAQALARLGVGVTLLDDHDAVLPGADPDAARVVAAALRRDGVRLLLGSPVVKIAPTLDGGAWLGTAAGGDVAAERLVLATGWRAATDGLGLPSAGVGVGPDGVVRVDAGLVTSAPDVLAAGGVAAGEPHAGAALAMGAVAGANAVSRRPSATWSAATVATLTLTEPEVATVGVTDPRPAGATAGRLRVGTVRWAEVDRAVLSGGDEGFVRVLVSAPAPPAPRWTPRRASAGTVRVVGATVVGSRAGDLVAPLALAIGAGLPASTLAGAVSADPSWASALRLAVARAQTGDEGPGTGVGGHPGVTDLVTGA